MVWLYRVVAVQIGLVNGWMHGLGCLALIEQVCKCICCELWGARAVGVPCLSGNDSVKGQLTLRVRESLPTPSWLGLVCVRLSFA
jgi:hypothetical protein